VTTSADLNSFSTEMQSTDVTGWKATNDALTKPHERIVPLVMLTLTSTINPICARAPVEMPDGESMACPGEKLLSFPPVSKDLRAARFWLIM